MQTPMDMKLEVIVVPVVDVDNAKEFYTGLGWRLDADFTAEDGLRVVQITPTGSGCSIIFGRDVTRAAPGSLQGLHLVVDDVEAARDYLINRGVQVSDVFHDSGACSITPTVGKLPVWIRNAEATRHSPHSPIPTATSGSCRRSPNACRDAESFRPNSSMKGNNRDSNGDRQPGPSHPAVAGVLAGDVRPSAAQHLRSGDHPAAE
jgi:catechol 2,3-dioxygenase-like lactoylglutathione lyase family enzyme